MAVLLVCVLSATFGRCAADDVGDNAAEPLTFDKDVLPIFRAKCFRCHAGVEPKAGLNLSQPSSLLVGGDSGAAIRIASAEFSLLYERVASDEMPAVGQKLTADEKGVLRAWINSGAQGVGNAEAVDSDDDVGTVDHWSFNPPVRPEVPAVDHQDRVRNAIDAFVLEKLEKEALTLAPEADRLTLLRRASLDLTGLPPTPTEIQQFLDDGPGAYARMIDRLLQSPHYGERWGRHWLDVAGYADSAGVLSADVPLPLAWRYRDYVTRAFNSDKPYDRFLQEQIAGDELTDYWTAYETMDTLPPEVIEGITATGFLRTAPDASRPDFSTIKNAAAQYYYPTIFDTLQIVCSSTMGLTVQCARCHNHKFDPIPQVDYYRMQAVFTTAYRPKDWIPQTKRRLEIATKRQQEEAKQHNAEVDKNVAALKGELAALKHSFAQRLFEKRLELLPEQIRADVKAAFDVAEDARGEVQTYLVEKFRQALHPDAEELDKALEETFEEYPGEANALHARIAAEERHRRHFDEIRALYDLPGAVRTPLLLRGDPLTPGPDVEPGVISSINAPEPFAWTPPAEGARTSGRRLAFARWLTQPEHPLTARVMVNRIWQHHFGRGIVATSGDFGISGDPPSHPKLLDWLATEFVRSGWSIKHLHRLILTSSTWRQRSRVDVQHREAGIAVDPENRLLRRQNIRRIEAEPLRDAVLAASGTLDEAMFGAPLAVARLKSGEVVVPNESQRNRRSIYIQILRLNPETMLRAFDQPEMTVNCTQRSNSTVSTQALTLLNSEPIVRAAYAFADRVLAAQPEEPADYAVLTAFSRAATAEERESLSRFLEEQTARYLAESEGDEQGEEDRSTKARRQALADLCHMLLSSNEFAYVD